MAIFSKFERTRTTYQGKVRDAYKFFSLRIAISRKRQRNTDAARSSAFSVPRSVKSKTENTSAETSQVGEQ